MTLLTLEDLTLRRGPCPVVEGVSLTVAEGEFVGLIGPNGAGKTTLLRGALGLLPAEGHSSLAALPPEARARAAAWLPQVREIAWPVSVEALVALGRLPHHDKGDDAVETALERMGLGAFRDRRATELSGGEQARVLIARALAQEAPLLLADEPVAGLDPAAQIAAMRVFAELASEGGAVLSALHDLGLAARHCTRLIVLSRGRIVADGTPREVLTAETLASVFGIRAHFADTPEGPVFQPLDTLEGA
ncbi:ABC transporter ATP-binding protein [Ostreiculturibacter nitratireducens]|uniref:ABC transporter ATP-binding protein n=1 Tax=Ostreiculturibacter nitratireducens TaxID=3075226 RepID=UPI0031B5F3B2